MIYCSITRPIVPLFFLSLISGSVLVSAAPQPGPIGKSINLLRRRPGPANDTAEEWGLWAKSQKEILESKYGGQKVEKRTSGMNLITNQNADSSFFGSIAVGTPPVSYNVILDTGSSDLWLADQQCDSGCNGVATFDPSQSSTFTNESLPFSIKYGSGAAEGSLGQDVVQMAGFSVQNQIFGVCDMVSSGLITSPVSGLMGLAWGSIASSGATPFWQTLASAGVWDEPLMTFQLTRFINQTNRAVLEAGGTFTMGGLNSSLYTGEIDYVDVPSDAITFWTLPLTALTVQGSSVNVGSGESTYAAIDTGTTLVGGPALEIGLLFAQIPGSSPATGNYDGYYQYPCNTTVEVGLSFGSQNWSISPADFQLMDIGGGYCIGAFFELSTSSPSWIIGDTFLKNVFSVFRYSPPSVGFAALSETALAMNAPGGNVPTATIGAVASATASGGTDRMQNGAVRNRDSATRLAVLGGLVVVFYILF